MALRGEQASGKSTLARILRMLIDPQTSPALALPGSTHDLMVTAANGWLLIYKNISAIADWSGSPLELYQAAAKVAGKNLVPRWPKMIHTFGSELRRIAPQLRLHGVSLHFERRSGKWIVVLKADQGA